MNCYHKIWNEFQADESAHFSQQSISLMIEYVHEKT